MNEFLKAHVNNKDLKVVVYSKHDRFQECVKVGGWLLPVPLLAPYLKCRESGNPTVDLMKYKTIMQSSTVLKHAAGFFLGSALGTGAYFFNTGNHLSFGDDSDFTLLKWRYGPSDYLSQVSSASNSNLVVLLLNFPSN